MNRIQTIRNTALTLAVCFAQCVSFVSAAQVPGKIVNSEKGVALGQFLTRLHKFGFHGSVLVAQKGEIVLHHAYGLSQPENNVSWTVKTPASIGSVVKQFTGAAIMKLEMRDEVSTDDLISKYFENVPDDKQGVTLHHLLTHLAGLPGSLGFDFDAISKEQYLNEALAVTLTSTPGEMYAYSNVGYSLLAMIVEQVSGIGFEEFLRKEFFDPLGMSSTGWRIPEWDPTEVALSHDNAAKFNSLLNLPDERWHIEGNGGLYSTPADMYRWYLALQDDVILSSAAKKKIFTRHIPEGPEGRSFYGYGWVVMDTRRGGDVIWHNGGGAAGAFAMYQYVNDSAVFIVFTNRRMDGGYPMDDVAIHCSRILFGEEYSSPPEVIDLDQEKMSAAAGEYALPDGSNLSVRVVDGAIEIAPDGQSAMDALFPSEMAPMLPKHNGKSVSLIKALSGGDFVSAAEMFSDDSPKEELIAMLKKGWVGLDSLGEFVSAESHGTRMGQMAEAYLTVKFTNGSERFKSVWMMGKCAGLRSEIHPPVQRLLPVSENSFASFSLQGGATSVSFDESGALLLSGPAGDIEAIRSN